jgi:hypothetical protein
MNKELDTSGLNFDFNIKKESNKILIVFEHSNKYYR